MSLQKNYSRKSLSFFTPQSRKIQTSQARLSLASNDPTPEKVLENLLNDPLKRALLVEVLSQDVSKTNQKGTKDRTGKGLQTFKYESPSALCRRRALAKMQGNSGSSGTSNYNKYKLPKVPFHQILKGVTAYVEIMSQGKDRTSGVKSLMQAMGADVRDKFSRDLTHVVFKDGAFRTYQKAKLLKVQLVSVLWVDAARRHECRMPEKDYPALGSNASSANVSSICHQFQKEYQDVLQEELNRSKMSILPDLHSEDIVDSSQNCDRPLKSLKSNTNNKNVPVTPNSMYLNSTPEITSDSDSDHYFISKRNLFKTHKDNVIESGIVSIENVNTDKNTEDEQIELLNLNNKLAETGSQSEEISPLRISTNSNSITNTPLQPMLNYKNVTQRKKNTVSKNKVNIITQHIVKSNSLSTTEVNCNKKLEENTEKNSVHQQSNNFDISSSCQNVKNTNPLKISRRKLYNVDDDILVYNQKSNLKDVSKVNGCELSENSVKCSNIEKDNRSKSCRTTPKNVNKEWSLKKKECATIPRRRSTRLFQHPRNESPQKRLRRSSVDENILQSNINLTESDENDVPLVIREPKEKSNLNADSAESDLNDGKVLKGRSINAATPKNCKSVRRILHFTPSSLCSNEEPPLNNFQVIEPTLQKNSTICTAEAEIHDSSHAQTKNSNFTKPSRRSMRISSFRNTSTTSNLKSCATPQKNLRMNNTDNSNNDASDSDILVPLEKNGKLQKKNIGSSNEFIFNGLRKKDLFNNDYNESINSASDQNTSKKIKPKYIPNVLERNNTKNQESDIESSVNTARRSTLDFMPKQPVGTQNKSKDNTPSGKLKYSQHTKSVKKTSIVCTRFHSTEVQVFQQIVKKLGLFLIEDEVTEKTTHLVAAESRRTVNLLRAIARGCWILKSEWLYRSLEADQWLPEEDYELCDFSDAVQKSRQERQAFGPKFSMDIFQNCGRIYISRGTNPRCSDLQELVTLCKGTITTITRNADIVVGEYIDDKSCVTVSWIMDSITFYRRKSLKNYIINPLESD